MAQLPDPPQWSVPKKRTPDELDKLAATRVVSVVVSPELDGTGTWKLWVDCDDSIDPWQAREYLEAGSEYMEQFFPERQREEEDD